MRIARNLLFLSVICATGTALAQMPPNLSITKDGRLRFAQAKTDCPDNVVPVCGTKNGKRVRYNNACEAERDGATNITKGDCEL
jgi:hypothetical protein